MLTPDQLAKISEIRNPVARQRFAVFFQLPNDLQNSMTDEKTSAGIWTITKNKYNLPDEKVSVVAKIIGLIFLGELPIKNFIAALKNELGVDVPTAQAIAQDINLAIFQPVRESLIKIHGLERDTNMQMRAHDTNNTGEIRNPKPEILNKSPNPNFQISKPKPANNNPPPSRSNSAGQTLARPASYTRPVKNVVDLKHIRRKGKYNGFFT